MQNDGTLTVEGTTARWTDPLTNKQRAAVQREVTRLVDELAPQRAPARPGAATPAVQCHRLPRGCVLQGAERAVSLSWFPASAGEDAFGELQLVTWRGVVSLPGSAAKRAGATMIGELILVPIETESGVWRWQGAGTDLDTDGVVARCRTLLDSTAS